MSIEKPVSRPVSPRFSSGPCAKIPGWTPDLINGALTGRSHRSSQGKARLKRAIGLTREVLQVPDSHLIGIVPASDTGAVEMALWSLLGARGVDLLAWESFGEGWVSDVLKELELADARVLKAPYGELPDLARVDFDRDVVFTWNGTTSGVRVPNGDFIPVDRKGLTICDATSAAFAMELPWDRLDVVTWSWQKALGGEGGHGMLALGPRALERLASYRPRWPLPKLFRMAEDGKVGEGLFRGDTINTPSMLCVEDALDGLRWAEATGGLPALIARCEENAAVLREWVERTAWIEFLAAEPAIRSTTSVCLRFADPALDAPAQSKLAAAMTRRLEEDGAALDIGAYRSAPPGLRLWAGPTVEAADLRAALPWLDWAYADGKRELGNS